MTGGNYSLTGGFWSMISVVQTAGLPNLTISPCRQQRHCLLAEHGQLHLATEQQSCCIGGLDHERLFHQPSNGTNSITITPPAGNLFFRLANP